MSIDNFNFELFGRTVFAMIIFAINILAAYGIFRAAEKFINKRMQKKKPKPAPKEDVFFFGPISDWSEWK